MKVYIIGAGPGDPELITVKGHKIIAAADVIVYTGSLVPKELLQDAREDAVIHNSAGMTLDEIISIMAEAYEQNKLIARVHTGDPSIYGSTAEQMRQLDKRGIPWEVIPGVSSFNAAAAAIKQELTLPETSQTIIISRAAGRTPVPPTEDLEKLAAIQGTLVLFLSITLVRKLSRKLAPFYGADCPVAVIYKASCPDQKIIRGTLSTITKQVTEAKITSQSIIIIGKVLACDDFPDSRLYAADFTHQFRKASLENGIKQ